MSRRSSSTSAKTGVSGRLKLAAKKAADSHVKVAVRCRPISAKEIKNGHQSIVEFEEGKRVIVNNVADSPSDQLGTRSGERSNLAQVYEFDAVFDGNSSQATVYDSVCRPIVGAVLEGYNGTIFAYGQTGTGKTHTMEGSAASSRRNSSDQNHRRASDFIPRLSSDSTKRSIAQPASAKPSIMENSQGPQVDDEAESSGVIPRAFKHIFDHIQSRRDVQFLVRASYMEIYQEEIHDLLRKDRMKLRLHERPETGVYVKDLTSYVCKSRQEIEKVMRVGNQNRKVGATDMNEHSSRSHAIFIITIEQQQSQTTATTTGEQINVSNHRSSLSSVAVSAMASSNRQQKAIRVGRLNLVDLAGSERQRKTNNSGQRHKESIKINLSLSALGNVINSLMKMNEQQQSNNSPTAESAAAAFHVPYRDSKLTRLLQDSLGGNSRTLMIANIGPASYNYDETINTLNYASRAKCIQNRPRLNEDPKDALLRQLQDEIRELRSKLASMTTVVDSDESSGEPISAAGLEDKKLVAIELLELREKLASLESKLLNGQSSELDHRLLEGYTQQQITELERNKARLQEQVTRETRIRDELEKREEVELETKQSYSSVQQEIDAKRALIRQVLLKTKTLHNELESAQGTYRVELDELDQLQYVLQKELRLKCLIMDNFIPNLHVNQLLPRMSYDERRDRCSTEKLEMSLDDCSGSASVQYADIWQASEGRIRPRSELERISETINPNDARYKWENVLGELRPVKPNLGEPPKRFADGPITNSSRPQSRIQTMIESALNEHEPDVVI